MELEQISEKKPKFNFGCVTSEMPSRHPSENVEGWAGYMSLGSTTEVGTRHLVMEKMRCCQGTEYIYSHWDRDVTCDNKKVCDNKKEEAKRLREL